MSAPERRSEREIVSEWETRVSGLLADLEGLQALPYPRFGATLIAMTLTDALEIAKKLGSHVRQARSAMESGPLHDST